MHPACAHASSAKKCSSSNVILSVPTAAAAGSRQQQQRPNAAAALLRLRDFGWNLNPPGVSRLLLPPVAKPPRPRVRLRACVRCGGCCCGFYTAPPFDECITSTCAPSPSPQLVLRPRNDMIPSWGGSSKGGFGGRSPPGTVRGFGGGAPEIFWGVSK